MANGTTRRAVLGTTSMAAMTLALGGPAFAKSPKLPNIVFILADDLGYADIASYGRPDLKTPNIDRIGVDGVKLTQAYANSAVCTASRTALITGRYQYRLRIGLEEPLRAQNREVGLPPDHPTLPSLLRKAGYGTTLVGKWHLGSLPKFGPLQSGYDHFYGFRSGAVDYYSHQGTDHRDDLWDDDVAIHQTGYLTALLGQRAVEVINGYAKSGKPFLLSLHFNAPHWPWEAPGDQAESDRLAKGDLFDFDGGAQRTYQKMIEAMDDQVGRVLKALDSNGIAGNTIVIFTSDNGGERFADTWPFSGKKTELLEGGLRIPAVIKWPGHIPKRRTSEQVAITMDWLPTLLAAAGAAEDPAYPSDGMNLLPVLTGMTAITPRKLFWRFKANAQRALRDGDLKILKILDNSFLFNVVDDPLERANLKARMPDIYKRMSMDWDAWDRTMLPEVEDSNTAGIDGSQQADHIGASQASSHPDTNPAWPPAETKSQ